MTKERGSPIPSVSRSPIRLGLSLLFSDNPVASRVAARLATGLALRPLGRLLARRERRIEAEASPPERPILLVCGPPRSGTTLVATYLIDALDVCYINNLAGMFPASPLAVNQLWGPGSIDGAGDYQNFYGRSRRLSGINDGLEIWDRWAGADRADIPLELRPGSDQTMPAFFGALEDLYEKPVVNKQNRLCTFAHLVAPILPTAHFLFLEREPLWLAQSLYIARQTIGRDADLPYGIRHPDRHPEDPIADVCAQTRFLLDATHASRSRVPENRAIPVPYETFCRRPAGVLDLLEERLGNQMPPRRAAAASRPPDEFEVSRSRRLPPEVLDRMAQLLDD